MPLNVIRKKKFCVQKQKSSAIWAKPHSRDSAKQLGRTERLVGHYVPGIILIPFAVLHAFSALVSMMHKDVILIPKDEGL